MLHSDANTVSIQPLEETDRRLRDASTSADAASRMPAVRLCSLLGSDAVMMCAITRYRQKSGVGTFTSAVFIHRGAWGRDVDADFAMYVSPSGNVIWQQHVRSTTGLFTSTATLGNAVGTAVAETFPYTRKPADR